MGFVCWFFFCCVWVFVWLVFLVYLVVGLVPPPPWPPLSIFPLSLLDGGEQQQSTLEVVKKDEYVHNLYTGCNKAPSRLQKEGVEIHLQIWSQKTPIPEHNTRFWSFLLTSGIGFISVLFVLYVTASQKAMDSCPGSETTLLSMPALSFSLLELKFLVFN